MTKQIKSKTEAQKQYAAKKDKITEVKKVADKAAREAVKSWKAKNPDCSDLDIRPMNVAYIRRKGGITKAILELALQMMYPPNWSKTQAALLEEIKPKFPEVVLHNSLWQRKLSSSLLNKIAVIVNGNSQKSVNLQKCKDLSQIRKKVKSSQQIAKGSWSCRVNITITKESVIIGKESYALEHRSSGYGIRVPTKDGKRCLVRMEGLAAALMRA